MQARIVACVNQFSLEVLYFFANYSYKGRLMYCFLAFRSNHVENVRASQSHRVECFMVQVQLFGN